MANKTDNSKTTIAVAIGVSAIAVIALVVLGKVLLSDIFLNQKVLSKKNTTFDQMEKNTKAAPQLVDAYNALGPQADYILRSLPTSPAYKDFIAAMEVVGSASGARVNAVSPSTATDSGSAAGGSGVASSVYSVSIDTSYPGLLAFLNNLQISAWPMQVKALSVSGSGNNIHAELTVSTFYAGNANIDLGKEEVQ